MQSWPKPCQSLALSMMQVWSTMYRVWLKHMACDQLQMNTMSEFRFSSMACCKSSCREFKLIKSWNICFRIAPMVCSSTIGACILLNSCTYVTFLSGMVQVSLMQNVRYSNTDGTWFPQTEILLSSLSWDSEHAQLLHHCLWPACASSMSCSLRNSYSILPELQNSALCLQGCLVMRYVRQGGFHWINTVVHSFFAFCKYWIPRRWRLCCPFRLSSLSQKSIVRDFIRLPFSHWLNWKQPKGLNLFATWLACTEGCVLIGFREIPGLLGSPKRFARWTHSTSFFLFLLTHSFPSVCVHSVLWHF